MEAAMKKVRFAGLLCFVIALLLMLNTRAFGGWDPTKGKWLGGQGTSSSCNCYYEPKQYWGGPPDTSSPSWHACWLAPGCWPPLEMKMTATTLEFLDGTGIILNGSTTMSGATYTAPYVYDPIGATGTLEVNVAIRTRYDATFTFTWKIDTCSKCDTNPESAGYDVPPPCEARVQYNASNDYLDPVPTPVPPPGDSVSLTASLKGPKLSCTLKINSRPANKARLSAQWLKKGSTKMKQFAVKLTDARGKASFAVGNRKGKLRCAYGVYSSKWVTRK